jgi:hypothetical protein
MPYAKFLKVNPNALVVATAAYSDNDVVGGLLTFELTGLSQNGGLLNAVMLTDAANQSEPYRLFLFNEAPSTIDDADAFAPTIADLKKLFAIVTLAALDYVTVNSLQVLIKSTSNVLFSTSNGRLYGYLVANGSTPDYAAATDLSLTLMIQGE